VTVPDAAVDLPDAAMDPPDAGSPDAAPVTGPGLPFPIVGFGASTLGGFQADSTMVHVTSLADDGAGTLREALQSADAPRVVLFDVDGTVELLSALVLPSNITVDGRGRDITLRGKGLRTGGSDHIIIVNLTLEDIGPESEDGVQIGSVPDPAHHVVLDHLTLHQNGDNGNSRNVDEAISVVWGSSDITIGWCRFERWEKVLLAGNGDAPAATDAQISITFHHNLANETGRRHPQARHGRFDVFNNVLINWHMYGAWFLDPYPESFGAQIQDRGQLRFENNVVSRQDTPFDTSATQADHVTRCESGGALLESGTFVSAGSTAALEFGVGCAAGATVFERPYSVVTDAADEALRTRLQQQAGSTL